MTDGPAASTRPDGLLRRLGGYVGLFAAMCPVFAALLVPFRLWVTHGGPLPERIAAAGLDGTIYAVVGVAVTWTMQRDRRGLLGLQQMPHRRFRGDEAPSSVSA